MPSSLLDSLNPEQRCAAEHLHGPALVIAGAGSGKTRTVVHRIAHLLDSHDVHPYEILAVTFTNKAAAELRERVKHLIGAEAQELWVSTFHSACLRILRTYGELIDLERGFAIYDDADQLDVLKEVIAPIAGLADSNPRVIRSVIDRSKSNLWTPDDFARHAERELGMMVAGMPIASLTEAYMRYQQRLHALNAVDFNDILLRTVELFQGHPEVLAKVQQRAVFIHVDEYQDTNAVQYTLTKQLASRDGNLMVVGDPDQSIYAFRGADISNILQFEQDYPEATVYRLELNYRSVGNILNLANGVILANEGRLAKDLRPVKELGHAVERFQAVDHRTEADFVARSIERLCAENSDYNYIDFAVLYRTNAQSRAIEEALRRASIPAKIIGGVGFYDRREVKDILAYTKAALNPADDIAWRRVLNRPKRGIGKTSEEKVNAFAVRHGMSFARALTQADQFMQGTPALKRIEAFVAMMDDFAELATSLPAVEFLSSIIDQSLYRSMLREEGSFEAQARLENLEELLNAVAEWQQETNGAIEEFLDEAALLASVDDRAVKANNPEQDADDFVTLMTLHNAKGLEFPVVFMVGMEDNLIPHRSSLGSQQEIEEERRLLYVGITRAQERLLLSHAESRMSFGRSEYSRPSRFFEDMPADGWQEIDVLGQALQKAKQNRKVFRGASSAHFPDLQSNNKTRPQPKLYKGGEKVRHAKFGQGTVVGVSGEGKRVELTIIFDKAGTKKLLMQYAKLEAL